MITLNDALIELVDGGQVEPKEAYMKAIDKTGFSQALRSRGHDTSLRGRRRRRSNRMAETGHRASTRRHPRLAQATRRSGDVNATSA